MKLSGKEIEKMYNYALGYGMGKIYTVGNEIPHKNGGIGYKRYISTNNAPKYDVADINRF